MNLEVRRVPSANRLANPTFRIASGSSIGVPSGLKDHDAKRQKELERENTGLKRIVADQASTSTC